MWEWSYAQAIYKQGLKRSATRTQNTIRDVTVTRLVCVVKVLKKPVKLISKTCKVQTIRNIVLKV